MDRFWGRCLGNLFARETIKPTFGTEWWERCRRRGGVTSDRRPLPVIYNGHRREGGGWKQKICAKTGESEKRSRGLLGRKIEWTESREDLT